MGHVKVENVCVDMCEGINCGIGGNCRAGNCSCDDGYVNFEKTCLDLCEGVDCGNGGTCSGGNCNCQKDYANVDNFCEETCAFMPCKELITMVFTKNHNRAQIWYQF